MDRFRSSLLLLCILGIFLVGCYPETTVILPPESTVPTTLPTTSPTTLPTAASATEPTTEPTTQPTTAPTTAPTTEPTTAPTTKPTTPDLSDHVIGSLEREILAAINGRRSAEGLSDLTIQKKLCAIAAIRARECVQNCSPTRPDGRNWSSVLRDHGSTGWDHTAEIRLYCSKGFPADLIVDTWMSTDSAARNILSADFRKCGIGVKTSGSTTYIVVIFVG